LFCNSASGAGSTAHAFGTVPANIAQPHGCALLINEEVASGYRSFRSFPTINVFYKTSRRTTDRNKLVYVRGTSRGNPHRRCDAGGCGYQQSLYSFGISPPGGQSQRTNFPRSLQPVFQTDELGKSFDLLGGVGHRSAGTAGRGSGNHVSTTFDRNSSTTESVIGRSFRRIRTPSGRFKRNLRPRSQCRHHVGLHARTAAGRLRFSATQANSAYSS